ncbi:MAG: YbaK/EbsC family protein [Spirochaetia bacterium]|nr:YbaK/EbsC family protein [Spirochaetia bacterium]
MSIQTVREYFRQFGIEDRIMELDMSSATVELAAQALGTEGARIAKSLSFDVDGRTVIIVTAGNMKIDNRKYKDFFGRKALMLRGDEVPARTGHPIGGVCPFALQSGTEVYLDVSLKKFSTVFPACGSTNSAIELTPDELEKYSGSLQWIDVCKEITPAAC